MTGQLSKLEVSLILVFEFLVVGGKTDQLCLWRKGVVLHDYLGITGVDFEVDFFKPVPVVDDMLVEGLPFEAAVEHLADEVVVGLLVELNGLDVVHQVDYLQGHLVAQHLGGQSLFQFLSVEVCLHSLGLSRQGVTSLFLAQGSLPSLR